MVIHEHSDGEKWQGACVWLVDIILFDDASRSCPLALQLAVYTHSLFLEMSKKGVKLLSNKENELEVFCS